LDGLFALMGDGRGRLFFDLGCGDGRVLEAAAKHGFICIGIELDGERAAAARQRLFGKPIVILTGDVRDFDISAADLVYLWLFPQLLEELELPTSARIISYHHKIAGSHRVDIEGEPFYIRQSSN